MLQAALAYIDPGSGSLLIQVVIATVVAVPFFLRQQIARVVQVVRRRPASPESAGAADATLENRS